MIVISVQAAGKQEVWKQGAFTSTVFSSQSVVLSRIGFRVDPTSNSPQLPLPVSLAEACSRVTLAMLLRPPSQKRADFPAGLAD